MTTASAPAGPLAGDDLLPALHQEIARLPEKYRLPILLCDLEGLPQAQAAGQLHWSERTLRRRLAKARDRLKGRLARRGLTPDDVMLSAVLLHEARASLPAVLNETTVRSALDLMNHTTTAGALSTAAQSLTQEVLKIMLIQKLKLSAAALLVAGLMAWGAAGVWISRGDEPPKRAPVAPPQQATPPNAARQSLEADPVDAVGTFPVRGRVLDPDGNPVAGAEIYVRHEIDWERPMSDLVSRRRPSRMTTSGADGRFRFELDKAASDDRSSNDPAWHGAQIAAVAAGFGPAWINVEALLPGAEATLRLARDDVPIRGRALDSEGRPAAGVTIRVEKIGAARGGADLDAMLASGEVNYDVVGGQWFFYPTWLGQQAAWTTDDDGYFELKGIGRDRIVGLEFDSARLEHTTLCAMARLSRTPTKPRPTRRSQAILRFPAPRLVAATSELVLGPCKPITGTVRLKGAGKPLAGVRVFGHGLTTSVWVETTTDQDGRFRLVGLPKSRSYEVRAAPRSGVDPFLGTAIAVTDTAGLEPIETTLELPSGIIVSGRLIDTVTGRPMRANEIDYRRLAPNRNGGETATCHSGMTDPAFRITVPPGEGVILGRVRGRELPFTLARPKEPDKEKFGGDDGFSSYSSSYHAYRIVDIPTNAETFAVDLELTRGLIRKGRLVGPDNKPVAGARCYGLSPTWGYIKTLGDDTFEVRALEHGRPRLVIFAHQARGLVGSVVINDENLKAEVPLVVRLVPAGSIRGRLVDEDGLPLAGARLGVMTWSLDGRNLPPGANHGGFYCLWPDGEIFVSDADGRFQVDGLKPGIRSTLNIENTVRPVSYLSINDLLQNATIKPGEVRDVGDLKVNPRPE
jgi:hypothetical protein